MCELSAILFIESKALQSACVVELLHREYQETIEAAAVYSETDVIGLIKPNKSRLRIILLELMQKGIPDKDEKHDLKEIFEIDDVTVSLITGNIAYHNPNPPNLCDQVAAYVIVQIEEKQGTQSQILRGLSQCEGVIFAAALEQKMDIIIKVKSPNKTSFDNKIMGQIQSIPRVKTTQRFIIINDKYFVREEPITKKDKLSEELSLKNVSKWANKRK